VAMSVPTGLVISGSPITSSGTLAVTYAVNYGIPTLTKQSDWDDAYTWVTNFPDQLGNAGKFLTTNGSALSWASLVTGVSSVFGRTGAVVAQSGDYTTAQVTESGNLYYTDARARASVSAGTGISYNLTTGVISYSGTVYTDSSIRALFSAGSGISYNNTTGVIASTITQYTDAMARASLSFTAGSGAYNSTTGVITIPTNTSQLTNGANFITLASLSASSPLSYNNTTGAFSIAQASGSTNGFLSSTDWNTFNNKQNALGYTPVPTTRTLTINGTAYDLSADRSWTIAGTISGLTTNYIPKATGATTLGNSLIYDNGSGVGINTTSILGVLTLPLNTSNSQISTGSIEIQSYAVNNSWIGDNVYFNGTAFVARNTGYAHQIYFGSDAGIRFITGNSSVSANASYNASEKMRIWGISGNVSIGNTNNTYKLDVNNVGAGVANTRIYGNDQANVRLRLENAGAGGRTYEIVGGLAGANNSSFSIFDATASSTRLQIDSTGAATFSSSVNAVGNITSGTGINQAVLSAGNILFYNAGSSNKYIQVANDAGIQNAIGFNMSYTWFPTGNVGIGTTSPGRQLEVYSTTTDTRIAITNTTSTSGFAKGFELLLAGSDAYAYNYVNGAMIFGTNATERMRITSSGDVNIGSTPSTGYKFNVRNASGNYISFWSPTIGGVATNGFLSHNGGGFNSQVSMGYNATVHVFNGEVTGGGTMQVAGDVNISGAFKINGTAIGTGGGGVSGSGTTNYLAKWTSGTSLSNSNILDSGSVIYMYTNTSASNVQFYYESSTWGTGTNHFRSSVFPLALDGSTIYFSNGGTQRMYLNSSGSRLFTGNGNLDTIGSTASGGVSIVRFDSTTGIGYDAETIHVFYTAGTEIARFNTGGEFLLGTTTDNGAYRLQVNSQIWATNATIATSDVRLKDNIQDISNALSVIMGLKPRTFTYKQDKGYNFGKFTNTGFIAQEIKESMTGLNYLDSIVLECGNYYGVAYEKFIPILTKGIQEQQVMIEQLKEEIKQLKGVN